jgi:hypothetical protein
MHQVTAAERERPQRHRAGAQPPQFVAGDAAQGTHQRRVLHLRDSRQRRAQQRRRDAGAPKDGADIAPLAAHTLEDLLHLVDGHGRARDRGSADGPGWALRSAYGPLVFIARF